MSRSKDWFIAVIGVALAAHAPQPAVAAETGDPAIQATPAIQPPVVRVPAPALPQTPSLDTILAWDATTRDETVTNGTPEAKFTFSLTNISPAEVTILSVSTSCGCTVAKLPEQPWKLAPGTNGLIHATMNVAGKIGTTAKTLTVNSDKGQKVLIVRTTVLPPAAPVQVVGSEKKE
jgi:hypothetical protein